MMSDQRQNASLGDAMEKSLMIVTEAFELGGVETYIRCEVEELVRQGWRVHLVCGRRFSADLLPQGLASLTTGLALGPEASIREFIEAVDEIVDLARRERVSYINAHPFTSLIPALICASTLRIPCVATLHGPSSVAGSYGSAYDFMLASLVLPAVSEVSAVSQEVAALASPYVQPGCLSILPNAIDFPAVPTPSVPRLTERWLAVSRLDAAKVEGVIQFARYALEIGLDGVDICGDGPARARLEEALADSIESGFVRLLGSVDDVPAQVSRYAGVAGMGRVALEGISGGAQVVLVGYDGVKGLLDGALYDSAVRTNLSGRGVPTIDCVQLVEQLAQNTAEEAAALMSRVRKERGASVVWAAFAERLQKLLPVSSGIVDAYMEQLRAMHPGSEASAYWSREIMEVMARVVASPLASSTHLVQAFTIHSEAFTRAIVEQQGSSTRELVLQHPPLPVESSGDGALRLELREWMSHISEHASSLSEEAAASRDALRHSLEREVQRTLDTLRPNVEGLSEQLREVATRMAAEHRQESARLKEAFHAGSTQFADVLSERMVAESERIASEHRHESGRTRDVLHGGFTRLAESIAERLAEEAEAMRRHQSTSAVDLRSEFRAEFERLRSTAKHESDMYIELTRREMSAFRDTLRQQSIASAGEFRRDTRQAFSEVARGIEAKMERAIERMESTIRQDLGDISGGLNIHAEMNKDIIELNERIHELEQELVGVYNSSSWVLMRPVRVLKRLLLEPRTTWRLMRDASLAAPSADHAGSTPAKRSGRVVRAWNFIRRTVRTGRIDPSDKARLLGMVRANYVAVAERLGVEIERPLLADAHLADVFVWSVIDWHFRMQRPQHLAAAMAGKGHRVFYISNNFVDSATPGFAVEALDQNGRLFQVNLHVVGAPQIYFDVASPEQVEAIQASLAVLLQWTSTSAAISLVQHPFWLVPAQSLPNMRLVYDCMDHHGGFEDNAASVLAGERTLVESSDLLIVTSQWLLEEMEGKSSSIAMIRNATEYAHFCDRPTEVFVDPEGRRIIGYYGAIAEWFDPDLIRRVAEDHPHELVLLVGRDTAGVQETLQGLSNVRFTGEVPYRELPYWLHAFDVCLLPFKVIPLTLATNPVKVYEYLSAGKPTVSVDLPEMSQFEGLVNLATEPDAFSSAVSLALQPAAVAVDEVEARQAFARQQTWDHRASDLDGALEGIVEPKVSIIVLCYNNLPYTQACLHSLDQYSDYPNLEIIAVDNASSDGSVEYLSEWAAAAENRIFIANADNLGFSAGNNVGLRAATGEYLVVLNNDTYVTPGWVRGLVRHLKRNPAVGLVGPVTNNIGNEARIEINYASMEEMIQRAGEYTRKHPGQSFEMKTAAFFCVMISRQAYEAVGPMDEDFGVGFFEDDDYCRRLALNGFDVRCADDVFVHHHLSASFNALKADTKQILFEKNKKIYESKWGPWVPHVYRDRSPR